MPNTYVVVNPGMFSNWGKMDEGFLAFLDRVLQGCGWYTKFTSDYRDPNAQAEQIVAGHGAAQHSLHELGRAVDLRVPRTPAGTLDTQKYGSLVDSVAFYRKGIKVEIELDITPNDPHIHIGWYGVTGPLLIEPVCRHTGA